MLRTQNWRTVVGGLVLGGALALGAGCGSTPREREIERLNGEIHSYLADDQDQREALREDYADAREAVETRRDDEVAELRIFRAELLARIRESQHRTVTESLDRMKIAATDQARRLEIRAQLDELDRHFKALLDAAEERTTALIETRTRRRNKQLQDLQAELASKESDLEKRKKRFVEERQTAIQTVKRTPPAQATTGDRAAPVAPAPQKIQGASRPVAPPAAPRRAGAVEEVSR